MNMPLASLAPRLLAGFGTVALVTGVGLFASSRPAHTAGGPIPVNVTNTITNQDRDSPARQPFQARLEIKIEDGSTRGSHDGDYALQGLTVPPGKRLIVQTLTHFRYPTGGPAPPAAQSVQIEAVATVNGGVGFYPLPPVFGNGSFYLGVTQPVSLSADAGQSLVFNAFRNDTHGEEIEIVTVYGYLVDVP